MHSLGKAGSVALLGALLTGACGDSASSLSPTAPSAAVVSGAISEEASGASDPGRPKPDNSGPSATAFSDLQVGDRLHVRSSQSGTRPEGGDVNLQNAGALHEDDDDEDDEDDEDDDDDDDEDDRRSAREVDLRGTISLFNGVCPTISFTVGTAMVKTVATTKFKDVPCASIKNGDRVAVEGVRQTDGTVRANDVKVERVLSEVQGTLSLLSGTCPAISFTAGTAKVTTAATTTFKGGNCLALKNGDRVEVEGFRQTDGTMLAKDVRAVKTEAPVSEITGRVSLLSGTCPAIAFTVGTTRVTTGAATRFKDGACAAIKNGKRVEVKGARQIDRTLLATVVEID